MAELVRLSLKDGPVLLRGSERGVSGSFPLWDGIIATEQYPPGAEQGAYYNLSVEKPALVASEVRGAEADLEFALLMLAHSWPFAGGSLLLIETREAITSLRVTSNAAEVREKLLGGLRDLKLDARGAIETRVTYSRPPLAAAAEIARFARSDFPTRQLLKYYYAARISPINQGADWFVNLYKTRDALKGIYRGESNARMALSISQNEWDLIGGLTNNNDLRHPELTNIPPPLSREEVDRCYSLAWHWVAKHLRSKGLPAV